MPLLALIILVLALLGAHQFRVVLIPAVTLEVLAAAWLVETLLQSIFDLSGEVFWESVFRAFQMGHLDVPFSPHADNANKLMSMRDGHGSIRISDRGKVPISDADAQTERQLLASRGDRLDKTYRQLLGDINIMV